MRHALEGKRRDQDRQRDVCPENGRRGRDGADVDENPGPQLAPLERCKIVAQRDLVPGPARKICERVGVERLFGEPLVVPDVDRGRHRLASLTTLGSMPCAAPRRDRASAAAHTTRSVAKKKGLAGETWFPPRFTERAGFEPATHLSARTRFPVALLRPLGHLSVLRSG